MDVFGPGSQTAIRTADSHTSRALSIRLPLLLDRIERSKNNVRKCPASKVAKSANVQPRSGGRTTLLCGRVHRHAEAAKGDEVCGAHLGARSGNVQGQPRYGVILRATHASTNSPLRGMPEVPHSIPAGPQSLRQWVRLGSNCWELVGRVHPVLRVRESGSLYKVYVQRIEDIYGLETSPLPGLWNFRRNRFAQ